MPPRAKFSKEEIVAAALRVTRRSGMPALTARSLAAELGSSARPIFTVFDRMEEVCDCVIAAAREMYNKRVTEGLRETPPFKGVGMQYIRFAIDEPELFRLLFMSEKTDAPVPNTVLPAIEERYGDILSSVRTAYGLTDGEAARLYGNMWLCTHGIATLCATNTCRFTEEEIGGKLTEIFTALLRQIREGK